MHPALMQQIAAERAAGLQAAAGKNRRGRSAQPTRPALIVRAARALRPAHA